jgi:Glycosyl transferase 4-like domain
MASDRSTPQPRPALLCLSQSFAPDTTPTAIRASRLLEKLSARWEVAVVTEAQAPARSGDVRVEVVRGRRPRRLLAAFRRLRLEKLLEIAVWPDESIFWVLPAILAGRRLVRELAPRAIVVFMMPYSAGLAGIVLSRLTGLPLVLNLDDSLTCTDMHPDFPTRIHYRLARALEDFYARRADAVVYVSETNLREVSARAPEDVRQRFHLVRYGADRAESARQPTNGERFEIAYVGAMSGWWSVIQQGAPSGGLRGMYSAWNRLGRHRRTVLDHGTSSPAIVGRAIVDAIAEHPGWEGRVGLALYGNPYPMAVVDRALASAGVERVVTVVGPVPHDQVADILARADLLFITLPARVDGSRGGRISAKTYEYLTTDRPILAAVPQGENWDYLADKPGVWLVDPADERSMRHLIAELAQAKFAGAARSFDRERLRGQLSYETRAREFEQVIDAAITRASHRGRRPRALR